jgi:deoxyribodipyrimidine photo-lyase
MQRHLVWLRSDLRSTDNTALTAACSDPGSEVACVYAITPQQWLAHDVAGVRVDFELRTLAVLKDALAALNIPLLFLEAPDFSSLPDRIAALAAAHGVSAVFANRQYEINETARDAAVAARLAAAGIAFHASHDQCILPPGSVRKADGTFYSVFTPFKRHWLAQIAASGTTVAPPPAPRRRAFAAGDPVPSRVEGFASHVAPATAAAWWPAGEEEALRRLADFVERLPQYDDERNYPARDGGSRLSPYLATGAISPRQCLNAALNHQRRHGADAGSTQWIAELGWRDFYKHVLVGWPRVCRHRAFRPETEAVAWRHDEAEFRRWCEGRTGFPLVDAAMRQLLATGWMHNRLRMVAAMFLSKDLLIDWRWGERHFMRHLVDGDLAANNGGWQWSASTGNDAAPYFRIFNPVAQSRKFDPDGTFIRQYIPELRDLDDDSIHAPHDRGQSLLFTDYPPPMVDHGAARDRVLAAFRTARD